MTIYAKLLRLPFFQGIDRDELEAMASKIRFDFLKYDEGAWIARENDRCATLTLVTLIGYSTMAGAIGGGGVGDFAIRYGYQRFNGEVLLVAVIVLIAIVQLVQSIGDGIVHRMAYRRG